MNNENIRIPFHKPIDLTEDETELNKIVHKIEGCLTSGMLTNNKHVRQLESTISDIYDIKHAIAVSSATQGLVIALQSLLNINNKDNLMEHLKTKSITQAFTWYSTVYAIHTSGLFNIEYYDIHKDTWTIDYKDDPSENKILVPAHTFGNVSSVEARYKIYDGSHCLGSKISDFGDATVLSLAPTKPITSIEGGIILTENTALAEKAIQLRDKVSRMSEIHAIFGSAYFEHLKEVMNFKRRIFKYYSSHLDGIFQKPALSHNYNTIGMLTDLKIPHEIETRKYYEPLCRGIINTEYIYNKIVCLPSWYNCPYKEIVKLIKETNK